MMIDCARCTARGTACEDCVVRVLLGPDLPARLTADERAAVAVLAQRHMVPPLRLVSAPADGAWADTVGARIRAA